MNLPWIKATILLHNGSYASKIIVDFNLLPELTHACIIYLPWTAIGN